MVIFQQSYSIMVCTLAFYFESISHRKHILYYVIHYPKQAEQHGEIKITLVLDIPLFNVYHVHILHYVWKFVCAYTYHTSRIETHILLDEVKLCLQMSSDGLQLFYGQFLVINYFTRQMFRADRNTTLLCTQKMYCVHGEK